jgi:peptide/nickel transport system permease protein
MSAGYLLRRIAAALVTLIFVLVFNFFLFRVLGDPVTTVARDQQLTPREQQELRKEFGLDKPLPEQFTVYMKQTLQGNLGVSFQYRRPVTEVIADRIPETLLLAGTATVLATVIGVLIGIRAGWRRGSFYDRSTLLTSMTLYSTPEFLLGMVFIIVIAAGLGWFPISGYSDVIDPKTGFAHALDVADHLFLPLLTLTLGYLGEYALVMRASMLDVVAEDFVTASRAKGLRESAVRSRHVVPNALLPIVTASVLYFGFVIAGAVGVEYVFSYPGLGLMTTQALDTLDFPLLQGMFLLFSSAIIAANLIADVIMGMIDPRIRYRR